MAKLNFTGFETGNASECASTLGTVDTAYTSVKRTGSYALRVNPTTTGNGAVSINQFEATGKHTALTAATAFSTFYFRYATKPASNSEEIACWLSGLGQGPALRILSDGTLALYDSATLNASGSAALSVDTWYRIDMSANDTANTQEIKLYSDPGSGQAGTLLDTISGTIATASVMSAFVLGKYQNRNGQSVDFFYDDVCIDDAAYPGVGEVHISVPIGAGAAAGWTDGTGTTYAEADEIPPGSDGTTDTSYIQAAATEDNQDHTFNMTTASDAGVAGDIGAVKTMVLARTTSTSGTSAVAHRRLFNGSGFELTGLELSTSYQLLATIDETDPSGSGAITSADYDSIEVGMAANTIGQVQRFTVAYLTAWATGITVADDSHLRGRPYGATGARQMQQLLAT